MAITYLVKINGVTLPKLKVCRIGRNKLWDEAGRNMAGELRATLIGIFPKLTLEFAPTTDTEMQTIDGLLDADFFTVSWYDPKTKGIRSGSYYASDYENIVLDQQRELYDAFQVALIPVAKI
jgi:hypothetical protein